MPSGPTDFSVLLCDSWPGRVDGQNAQKAKIARYAGCEHNRDAVRADP
jgi:hypothetical protein